VRGVNRIRIVEFLRGNPDPFACRRVVRQELKEGDPRGQFGVFAQQDLARGWVIGAYKGVMWEAYEFDDHLALKSAEERDRAFDYAFDLFEGLTLAAHEEYANLLSLVNDFRDDVLSEKAVHTGSPNAEFYEFWGYEEGSVPMLVLITTKPVPAGGELLVDYTEKYWERHRGARKQEAQKQIEPVAKPVAMEIDKPEANKPEAKKVKISQEEAAMDALLNPQVFGRLNINC
jgi:hypothetical protein